MGNSKSQSKAPGVIQVVAGIVFGLLALNGLIHLPGSLASGDGATAAGAIIGLIVCAGVCVALLIFGIRRLKALRA